MIEAVEDWCKAKFVDHFVESRVIGDREDVLFRAYVPGASPRYELEVSYEAFEDYEANTIVQDLDRLNAAE
jgi:hypothetical protein